VGRNSHLHMKYPDMLNLLKYKSSGMDCHIHDGLDCKDMIQLK